MFRATLKSIAAHKRRVLSTAMAVLLGVAFLSGTLVLGDTMRGGFADTFAEANAGTDALVRSATEVGDGEFSERGLLPQSTLDQVRAVPGVAAAEPLVDATGQIVGADGDPLGGNGPPTFAAAWVDDPGLNPWKVAEGRAPEADNEVVIDRQSAKDGDLAVGDTITIRTPAPVEAELVGIATFGDADGMGGPTYAAFTTSFAQRTLLAEPGQVTGVVVAGDGSVSESALAARISDALPDSTETITAAALTRRAGGRHRGRLRRDAADDPDRVRRHRPGRGHLQHLQHLLDPGRPADPRVGPVPGARGVTPPGRHLGGRRGAGGRLRGLGDRHRSPASAWPWAC